MRTALVVALLTLCAAGCESPNPASPFLSALGLAPSGSAAIVEWRDGRIVRYVAPLADDAIPVAARRTSDEFVQPDGTSLFRGREWSEGRDGYRFVKAYGESGSRRTVLVSATGEVLERSHEVPVEKCPAPVVEAITGRGAIVRVEIIQGQRGVPDRWRVTFADEDGERWFADCTEAGATLVSGRILDAELYAGHSHRP